MDVAASKKRQDDNDRQLLSLVEIIKGVVLEYNNSGILKTRDQIKRGLIITFGSQTQIRVGRTRTGCTRAGRTSTWRIVKARAVYQAVQKSSSHLFLAFLSVVSATACTSPNYSYIVSMLLRYNKDDPVKLKLNTDVKEFLELIAEDKALTDNSPYIEFVKDLFPEEPTEAPLDPPLTVRNVSHLTSEHHAEDQPCRKRPRLSNPPSPVGTSKSEKSQAAPVRDPQNASFEGVSRVFSKTISDAIRQDPVQGNGITSVKGSVAMVFPVWGGSPVLGGSVDCLLSLEICESNVEQLAMLLFGAQIRWVEQDLRIVLNDGTLIISNSEMTLKGVQDEVIMKVFGLDIYNGIKESPVHVRELNEGKNKTECVSMIITKQGAILNLSLGLHRGLEIRNKLCT